MPSDEQMFKHMYQDALGELERSRMPEPSDADSNPPAVQTVLEQEYSKMLDSVITSLKTETPNPEVVFRQSLTALNRIERFRWLVENSLEAVKRDNSLNNSVMHYKSLGLLETEVSNLTEEKKNSPWPSNPGTGRFLRKLWDRLQRIALTVMELVTNAIKAIPQFKELKLTPTIGLSGPFPTFGLEFGIEADPITLHELFIAVRGAHT
jgi:hypothetical protein